MNIQITEATDYIKMHYHNKIDVAIILGTGLGDIANQIINPVELDYRDIPHFPIQALASHEGKLVIGSLGNKTVLAMKGRFHFFEGFDMNIVTLPIRVFANLGIDKLILINACGGIGEELNPGQITLIKDHLSFYGISPLRGPNLDEFGPRYTDMSDVYTKKIRALTKNIALEKNIDVKESIHAFFPGPMFETPAEINAFKILGATTCGMSNVPEAIVAHHCNMETLAISLVTNKAAGLSNEKITYDLIIDMLNKKSNDIIKILVGVLEQW